jgi:hypothetical protein
MDPPLSDEGILYRPGEVTPRLGLLAQSSFEEFSIVAQNILNRRTKHFQSSHKVFSIVAQSIFNLLTRCFQSSDGMFSIVEWDLSRSVGGGLPRLSK